MRVAFNVIDETIWFIDRPHEPWTVQAEARAAGRLDDERLRLAVRSALARHPMARARQAPWRFWQTGFTWEITEDAQVDALSIVDCPDDAAVARVRSDLYGHPVPLATSPPLRVRLAHHAAGDVVLLGVRSEEHTSELQSQFHLVCRLLLEKKKITKNKYHQHQKQKNTNHM